MDGARRKPGVGGLALPSTAAASQAGGSRVGVKLPEASVAEGRCRLASGPASSAQASQGGARARGFRQGWREERRGGGGTMPAGAGAPGAPTGWGRSSGVLRPRASSRGPTASCFPGDLSGSRARTLPQRPVPVCTRHTGRNRRGAGPSRRQPPEDLGPLSSGPPGDRGLLLSVYSFPVCTFISS